MKTLWNIYEDINMDELFSLSRAAFYAFVRVYPLSISQGFQTCFRTLQSDLRSIFTGR